MAGTSTIRAPTSARMRRRSSTARSQISSRGAPCTGRRVSSAAHKRARFRRARSGWRADRNCLRAARGEGRKIWGQLVPNGRVARGRERGYQIHLRREVSIKDHVLPAGTHTFFDSRRSGVESDLQPRAAAMGRVRLQPAFDARRFTVKPAEAPHEEYLRYTIRPASSNAAVVTLAWEKTHSHVSD